MNRRSLQIAAFCLGLVLAGSRSLAALQGAPPQPQQGPTVFVSFYNNAGLSSKTTKAAEKQAARIFARLGLSLVWTTCPVDTGRDKSAPQCTAPLSPAHLVVRALPRNMSERLPYNAETFGISLLGRNGVGYYAYVFCDRVQELVNSSHMNPGTVLGYVMAHEIGHLLLGVNSHAPEGIMKARWSDVELRGLATGNLRFSRGQAEQIHQNLSSPILARVLHSEAGR